VYNFVRDQVRHGPQPHGMLGVKLHEGHEEDTNGTKKTRRGEEGAVSHHEDTKDAKLEIRISKFETRG